MKFVSLFIMVGVLILSVGCAPSRQIVRPDRNQVPLQREETPQDVATAIESVAGALSGKALSEENLRKLSRELKSDKEARKAVEAVTDALSGEKVSVMFCPVDGKRYSPQIQYCPQHSVKLEKVLN